MSIPPSLQPYLSVKSNPSRYRSFSVNTGEKKYGNEYEEGPEDQPDLAASTAAAYAATKAQIHQHNLAVQAYANQASASRPRAKTTTLLDSPTTPLVPSALGYVNMRSPLENSITAATLGLNNLEYAGLPEAVQALNLGNLSARSNLEGNDDNVQDGPTRSLWLGSIPSSTTTSTLGSIFGRFGKIESSRVLVHKNCGFVNFESLDSATSARVSLNGTEIFPGAGPCKIGYAKEQHSAAGTPGNNGIHPSRSPDPHTSQTRETRGANGVDGLRQSNGVHAQSAEAALRVPNLQDLRDEILQIVPELDAKDDDCQRIASSIDDAIRYTHLESEIPPVPEASNTRIHDPSKLREIRKRVDNNAITLVELEEIAMEMLPEIAELAADYIGNTVVQKLFEFCSEPTREQMLHQLAPHLAEIGVHKNGTWAAQKIIDVTRDPHQMDLIVNSLRPYTVPLFLDQYGNYVLQGCLRFGYPYNNFIFETMLSRMWDIAQGRFGARAMRACLESHNTTINQQRMLASAISLHSVQLATNANGALLLTWLLDTCKFSRRRIVLAPRLAPHLVHLCTHKVAYLTVLKVINQRNEPEARNIILKALFFSDNDKVLEDILSDQAYGASLVYKILTTPFLDDSLRSEVVSNIKNVLTQLKVSSSQGYKRLMDEVGMSGRVGKADREQHSTSNHGSHQGSRPGSSHNMHNNRRHQQDYGNSYQQQGQRQTFPVQAMDPNSIAGYDQLNPAYVDQRYPKSLTNGINRGVSPADFYNGIPPYGNAPLDAANLRNLQFQQQQQQQQQLQQRTMQMNGNPMMQQQAFGAPPLFNPMMNQTPYGYNPLAFQVSPQQQMTMQQQQMRMPNGINGVNGMGDRRANGNGGY